MRLLERLDLAARATAVTQHLEATRLYRFPTSATPPPYRSQAQSLDDLRFSELTTTCVEM